MTPVSSFGCASLALTLSLLAGAARAVPDQINAQGVLWDPAGVPIDTNAAEVTLRLWSVASGGVAVWSETQSLALTDGVFNALLPSGAGVGFPVAVRTLIEGGAPLWLSIQLTGQAELPRVPLVSVPYALHARTAASATQATVALDLSCVGCVEASAIAGSALASVNVGYVPVAGGVIEATTVAGALAAIDGMLAELAASVSALGQSVPYAEAAATCDTASVAQDVACSGCIGSSELAAGAVAASQVVHVPQSGSAVTATTVSGAIAQLDARITSLGLGSGIGIYQNDGVTLVGKYIGTTTGLVTSHCPHWIQLDPSSNLVSSPFVPLGDYDCSVIPTAVVYYKNASCTDVWGAQGPDNRVVTDGVGTYRAGGTRIHMTTTGCAAGSTAEGNTFNGATWCNAWAWQAGVCVSSPVRLFSWIDGGLHTNESMGYVIDYPVPTPRCGGAGPCTLR